jgi:PAS domain-containing protein
VLTERVDAKHMIGGWIGPLSVDVGLVVSVLTLALLWLVHRRLMMFGRASAAMEGRIGRLQETFGGTTGAIVGVDPILEAVSDGAWVVGQDERVHSANRVAFERGWIVAGVSLAELAALLDVRTLDDEPFVLDRRPERRVLDGESVKDFLVRLRPQGSGSDVIVAMNGSPARDAAGRVIGAVMVARAVSEEIALAIRVRQMADSEVTEPLAIGF